ncbi:MAG: AEC family transporter [Actinobacteria bacterium]|nr:AEC family transporter [Actinomycetota bacterium]
MNNFSKVIIEVLGVTFPVFVVVALGFLIRRRKIIEREHVFTFNRLTYNFGLSTLVFSGIAENKFSEIFNIDIIKVIFPSYFLYLLLIFLSFYFTKLDSDLRGAIIVSSYRNNMAFIGLPVLLYAYGSLAAAKASIVIALLLPMNIIVTALFLQFVNKSSGGLKTVKILKEIFLDPVIIAVIAGLMISFFEIRLPEPVGRVFDILSGIAVPLALISIGASFKFSYIRKNLKYLSLVTLAKLVIFPLITVFFSIYVFKTGNLDRDILCILFATPVAVATYIQSQKYQTDRDFISSVIITSTVASAFTISAWLFVLKLI